jgi:hypothetical protein
MNTNFTPTAPSIASASMLVDLSISVWTAKRRDKQATAEVLADKKAVKSAGAFNKNLLADCEELASIQKFAANARQMHYAMTMPWSNSGLRLLPTKKFFDYQQAMTKLQGEFDRLVSAFLSAYTWQITQVHAKLGDLFLQDEYPTTKTLRHKFAFRLSYIPVPEVGDWRVDMEAEAREALREQYADFYRRQTEQAVQTKVNKLREQLTTFVCQLTVSGEDRGKIFDGTIDNIRELADMLAACNFAGDPMLTEAQENLERSLAGVCKDDLVRNPGFRESTRQTMEQVLKTLPSLGGWDEE